MTSTQATTILEQYRELQCLAENFTGEYDIRFDNEGNIESKENTSCNCHPVYEWQIIKSAKEFAIWLDKRDGESQ
jgi:hypothetical protein